MTEAAYLRLWRSGELAERAEIAHDRMKHCDLCPRRCGVDRTAVNETMSARHPSGPEKTPGMGRCNTGSRAVVCGFHPHFGEEAPLVGIRGSGTVFFSWCNLRCMFCQNSELSAHGEGREVNDYELAGMMLRLQKMGCHNVNLVSPSHVAAQILAAVAIAAENGLRVPLVYNTGGYDSVDTLRLFDGVVDIYMPDMKYSDNHWALRLSGAPDYVEMNRAAIKEMHRQVGDLVTDEHGIAERGLLVRHLVLPEDIAGTEGVVRFLAQEISRDTYINIMDQYRPCHQACTIEAVNRRVTSQEYANAVRLTREAGLHRLDRD